MAECLVPGFIFNVGRCGSVFLQTALGAASNATVVHEVIDANTRDYWWDRVKRGANGLDDPGSTYIEMRGGIMAECSKRGRKYIDVSPWNVYGFVPYILTFFPYGKFAMLVRNGKDNVRSWANRHPEVPFGNWCEYWARGNEHILSELRNAGNVGVKYFIIHLEELDGNSVIKLYDQFDLLGFNPDLITSLFKSKPNKTLEYNLPTYDEWPTEWKSHFDRVCGPVNRRLGYE